MLPKARNIQKSRQQMEYWFPKPHLPILGNLKLCVYFPDPEQHGGEEHLAEHDEEGEVEAVRIQDGFVEEIHG